ncbi:trehalose-phosphatase, partial [Chloroflexota bacterium]
RPALEAKKMVGIDEMVYIGNHGLERWAGGHAELTAEARDYSDTIRAVIAQLAPLSEEGISIEDKGVTVSVHYRLHPKPESARRAILTALQKMPEVKRLRIIDERKAIDLLPPGTNKGTAILELIQGYNLRGGIYLGDDATDIDAFAAVHTASRDPDFNGFAIGVISEEMPESFTAKVDFTLNGVQDVERFLARIAQIAGASS